MLQRIKELKTYNDRIQFSVLNDFLLTECPRMSSGRQQVAIIMRCWQLAKAEDAQWAILCLHRGLKYLAEKQLPYGTIMAYIRESAATFGITKEEIKSIDLPKARLCKEPRERKRRHLFLVPPPPPSS